MEVEMISYNYCYYKYVESYRAIKNYNIKNHKVLIFKTANALALYIK